MQAVVNSEASLHNFLGEVRELFSRYKYVKFSWRAGKDRSLDQNAISHVWYEQLSRELREDDALGWKCHCKLHFGVPILRAEDAEFCAFYDAAIKPLMYEQKLKAMKYTPVTSIMTKEQLSKYLETMRDEFLGRGVVLEFPERRTEL